MRGSFAQIECLPPSFSPFASQIREVAFYQQIAALFIRQVHFKLTLADAKTTMDISTITNHSSIFELSKWALAFLAMTRDAKILNKQLLDIFS